MKEGKKETEDPYLGFLGKSVKTILSVNAQTIKYQGLIISVSEDVIVLADRYIGNVLIKKAEISQIQLLNLPEDLDRGARR